MEPSRRINNFEQLKILADARRLAILRLLMAKAATLSQLGEKLEEHPARVRHHLKLLEGAGLVEQVETRVVRGFVEKYYRATAGAFFVHELLLPANSRNETIVALGSHDLALELLAKNVHAAQQEAEVLALPVGSLEGLVALREGTAQVAGCHLLDVESGEYNLPYVRHFFPDRSIALFTLAHREQGLLVPPGNPQDIRRLEDLARPEVVFVNRNRGSGTRLWLDRELQKRGLSPEAVRGYAQEVRTHTGVAAAIAEGRATTGLGLQAAAQLYKLDFIPLFQERYDLVLPTEQLEKQYLQTFFNYMNSLEFRRAVDHLAGYDTAHTGEQLVP